MEEDVKEDSTEKNEVVESDTSSALNVDDDREGKASEEADIEEKAPELELLADVSDPSEKGDFNSEETAVQPEGETEK